MNHSHAAPGTTRMTPHRARPPRRGSTKYPLSPATVRVLRWGRWFSLTLAVLTWAVVITALVTGSWGADLFLLVTNAVGAVLWPATPPGPSTPCAATGQPWPPPGQWTTRTAPTPWCEAAPADGPGP
ncbi:hypothetical protein ACW23B_17760 [Streptomyces albidoflavus]